MICNTCITTLQQEIKSEEIKTTQELKRIHPTSEILGEPSTSSVQRSSPCSPASVLLDDSTLDAKRIDSVSLKKKKKKSIVNEVCVIT